MDVWKVLSKGELVLLNGRDPPGTEGEQPESPALSHTAIETGAFIS